MKKLVVDCSIPIGEEGHEQYVSLNADEKKQRKLERAEALAKQAALEDARDQVISAIENAESLDELKQAVSAFIRGG